MSLVLATELKVGDELPKGRVIKSIETSDKFVTTHFSMPDGGAFWFDVFPLDAEVEVVDHGPV